MKEHLSSDEQLTRYLVKVRVVQRYEIEVLAADEDDAKQQAADDIDTAPVVDSYIDVMEVQHVK